MFRAFSFFWHLKQFIMKKDKKRGKQPALDLQTFMNKDQVITFLRESAQLRRDVSQVINSKEIESHKAETKHTDLDTDDSQFVIPQKVVRQVESKPGRQRAQAAFNSIVELSLQSFKTKDSQILRCINKVREQCERNISQLCKGRQAIQFIKSDKECREIQMKKVTNQIVKSLQRQWQLKKSLLKNGLTPTMKQLMGSLQDKVNEQLSEVQLEQLLSQLNPFLQTKTKENDQLQRQIKSMQEQLAKSVKLIKRLQTQVHSLRKLCAVKS